jgi:NTP pyrophosphatase (non-canonical NTP hydrolase)
MSDTDSISELTAAVRLFAIDRGWRRFHSPRNLATAIVVEASELLEPFQWDDGNDGWQLAGQRLQSMREEMADIAIYLLHLADVMNIDLAGAIREKMIINEVRWPNGEDTDGPWKPRDRSQLGNSTSS